MIKGISATREVFIGDEKLSLEKSLKIRNHSPTGFNWGYAGSGPAQLALAVCAHYLGEERARRAYQQFKFDVISKLSFGDDFELPVSKVENWINNWKRLNYGAENGNG